MNTTYDALIRKVCDDTPPVPFDVLKAMVSVESNFNPKARSKSDARGLCQLIPKWHATGVGAKVSKELGKPLTDDLWYDPEFSLRAGALHLRWCYTSDGSQSWERAVRKYHSGSADPPAGFVDGQGTSSDAHIKKFRAALASLTPQKPTEGTAMAAFTAYTVPGLSKPVYFPTGLAKVTIDLVPTSRRNIRSNQKRNASQVSKYTQHETANFAAGANARMHRNYLHNGAGGSYVGFNSVNDDAELYVLTPYDEVTWAAGTADGNLVSDHAELCVNAGINHTKARQIAAAWAAGVIHARGLTVAKALVQHNVWFGKNCPLVMRRDGLWPSFVNMVADFYNQIVAFTKGTPVPAPAGILAKGDTVKTIDVLNVREGYSTKHTIVKTLPVESELTIIADDAGRFSAANEGYTWYNVRGDFGTGWAAADWLVKADPVKPEEPKPSDGWPYPKPIVPAFWDELMKEGATHVFSDGTLWVRSNDLYRVNKQTKRLRVVGGKESVGPDLMPGDTFRDAAKGQGYDGKAYVITDGLTRVALEDLEFVIED